MESLYWWYFSVYVLIYSEVMKVYWIKEAIITLLIFIEAQEIEERIVHDVKSKNPQIT